MASGGSKCGGSTPGSDAHSGIYSGIYSGIHPGIHSAIDSAINSAIYSAVDAADDAAVNPALDSAQEEPTGQQPWEGRHRHLREYLRKVPPKLQSLFTSRRFGKVREALVRARGERLAPALVDMCSWWGWGEECVYGGGRVGEACVCRVCVQGVHA